MNSRFPSSRTPSSRPYGAARVIIKAIVAEATSQGITPSILAVTNINIHVPVSNATTRGLVPFIRATGKDAKSLVSEARATAQAEIPVIVANQKIRIAAPTATADVQGKTPVITSAEGTTLVFKGRDIKDAAPADTEIKIIRVIRPLKKPSSSHKIEIPARAGSWDFECGVEQDYNITVEIVIIADTAENIMLCAKAIETYLDGKGQVRFTDDTAIHQGQIYQGVYIYSDLVGNYGTATLVFECDAA